MTDSILDKITTLKNSAADLQKVIESETVVEAYQYALSLGSRLEGSPTDEVECHYACFSKATPSLLWFLDGDRKGPLACLQRCETDEGVLEGSNLARIRTFLKERAASGSNNIAMMALVREPREI